MKKVKNNIRGHYFGTSKIETLGRVVHSVISALGRLGEEDFKVGLGNITRPFLNKTPQELRIETSSLSAKLSGLKPLLHKLKKHDLLIFIAWGSQLRTWFIGGPTYTFTEHRGKGKLGLLLKPD